MSRVLPILFNTDMVRAILDGRKTVTRRIVKGDVEGILKSPYHKKYPEVPDKELLEKLCIAPYQPGDILYVRETWVFAECITCDGRYNRGQAMNCYDLQAVEYDDGSSISDGCFIYRADCPNPERIVWRPSIHMPKQAARIWLKVTDVRVERLQCMNIDDFLAEGVSIRPEAYNDPENVIGRQERRLYRSGILQ